MDITNRPLLRWAGSKRQQLPFLEGFWSPTFKRYVEPFAGSAALFFSINPSKARLSDTNASLVQTYRQVRANPDKVASCLAKLPPGKESYYRIRAIAPSALSAPEAAARFIYLNRFCFNGLYRTNLKGNFNVPFGSGKQGQLPDVELLRKFSERLKVVGLACEDFEVALSKCREGDFVYIDPPYAVTNKRIFRQYDSATFGISDLTRLLEKVKQLDKKGIAFVLSYAYEKEFRDMFREWKTFRRRCHRSIAGNAAKRRSVYEAVVTNLA